MKADHHPKLTYFRTICIAELRNDRHCFMLKKRVVVRRGYLCYSSPVKVHHALHHALHHRPLGSVMLHVHMEHGFVVLFINSFELDSDHSFLLAQLC